MSAILDSFTFPPTFRIPNLTKLTAPLVEEKSSPYMDQAIENTRVWLRKFDTHHGASKVQYLQTDYQKIDTWPGITYPDASLERLEALLFCVILSIVIDDMADAALAVKPDEIQADLVDMLVNSIIFNPDAPPPPYDSPLLFVLMHDGFKRLRETTREKTFNRIAEGVMIWLQTCVEQAKGRKKAKPQSVAELPSIEEFIVIRRIAVTGTMALASVEYGADVDIPDELFVHPVLKALEDCAFDIVAMQNDVYSFNKEQAVGDDQNLVIVVMAKRNVDLQTSINIIVDIVAEYIQKFIDLRKQLPSFGPEVDKEVNRYVDSIAHFIRGSLEYAYISDRYFRDLDTSDRDNLVVPLFPREY